jgi:AcrR family transcriptional regulator
MNATMPAMAGLRARKKRETAERIALAAGRLFAERGYDEVSVLDVAATADVSEQTVYNHFPTKEDLVFDRTARLDAALTEAVRQRAPGMPAAAAIRPVLREQLARTGRFSAEAQRGGLPRLAADSVALRRGALERTRLHAESLADALSPGDRPTPEAAIAGWALAGVLQLMLEELGAAQLAGEDTASTATRLGPELDRQLTALEPLG